MRSTRNKKEKHFPWRNFTVFVEELFDVEFERFFLFEFSFVFDRSVADDELLE